MRRPTRVWFVAAAVVTAVLANGRSVADPGDRWQWSLAPYLWATDISEDLLLDGAVVGGADTSFDDLVDKIDASFQLHFEGMRERWGLLADVNYVELSDSDTGQLGLSRLDVEIEETLLEAAAIYELYLLTIAGGAPRRAPLDETYLDGLLGARYQIPIAERWVLSFRGDVSAGGTDFIWTAQGLAGWRFGALRNSAVFFGYRHRELQYDKTDFLENRKTISGFGLGVSFGF
jgi:hypothetical protein